MEITKTLSPVAKLQILIISFIIIFTGSLSLTLWNYKKEPLLLSPKILRASVQSVFSTPEPAAQTYQPGPILDYIPTTNPLGVSFAKSNIGQN